MKTLFLSLFLCVGLFGQIVNIPTNIGIKNLPGAINSNYSTTSQFISGTSIPLSCVSTSNIAFYKTDSKAYYDCINNLYLLRINADASGNVSVGATVLGPKTIGAGANQLPAAATCTRCMTMVTDAASASDCTVGSGSSIAVCYSNGTLWGPLGAGATPVPTPSTTITLTAPRGYAICTGTCTVTLPVPAAGYEFCVMNDDAVATAITLAALGSGAMYENAIRTAYGTPGTGTMVLAAAQGNAMCLVGRDVTHYLTVSYTGSPTVN